LKRLTIKDIAKELNVHHSTVSRALRGDPKVRVNTSKMITKYANEHGYQVNMNALQLRGNVKNVIAVIVPNINHQFFSNIVSTIANLAYEKGLIVSVLQSNENYEHEKALINTVIQNNVAGVIASVSMETQSPEHFNLLKNFRIPLVLFDRICDGIDASKVLVNNSEIVTDATTYLVYKGRKRIAHISGPSSVSVFRDRQAGYNLGVEKSRLSFKRSSITNHGFTIEDGKIAVEFLFAPDVKPDALICDSYILLIGVLQKLRELKVKVPEDIAIIAFSDNPSVDILSPSITSIDQPDKEIAKAAFDLLMKRIDGIDMNKTENITIAAKITERYSC
jgi:LacI family transcriptional regulator